jgi:thioredoxin reductase (NADPH)
MSWDVIVVGGGPAGMSAALYTSRAKLKTLILEKSFPGGQAAITSEIENYPGFPEGITGPDLVHGMEKQAKRFGTEIKSEEVIKLDLNGIEKIVETKDAQYKAKAVILAMGARWKKLNVPGEKELQGRGVSFCATCDGAFFTDLPIVVVGGGDTAIEEALFLTRYASDVTIVHRRDELRATKVIQERAFNNKKIKFVWDSVVEEIQGDEIVEGVKVKNVKTGEVTIIEANGVFIAVGYIPNTTIVDGIIELNSHGYIPNKEDCSTEVPGVFAAGDLREKTLRQVITAVADGGIAAVSATKYIEEGL